MNGLLLGLLLAANCSSPAVVPLNGSMIVVERHPQNAVLIRPQGSSGVKYSQLTGAILVEFKKPTQIAVVERFKADLNLVHVRNLPLERFALFRAPEACSAPEVAVRLMAQPEVAEVTVEWFLGN